MILFVNLNLNIKYFLSLTLVTDQQGPVTITAMVPRAAVMKPQVGGLREQKCILSRFLKAEGRNPGVAGSHSL